MRSAERTLLAWVRTAVALIALGLVLAKFSFVLHKLDPGLPLGGSHRLSLALVVAGGLLDLLAGVAYAPKAAARALSLLVVVVIAGAAAYAAVTILPH